LPLFVVYPNSPFSPLSLSLRNFSSDDDDDDDDDVVSLMMPMLSQKFLMMMFVNLIWPGDSTIEEDRYWTHTSPGMYTSYVL
jgi:hypothetical protein